MKKTKLNWALLSTARINERLMPAIRESKKESPNKRLPYAVCTKKIYNNRKLKIPKNGAKNCRKTFKWYT